MSRRKLAGAILVALVAGLLLVVWLRQGGTPTTAPSPSAHHTTTQSSERSKAPDQSSRRASTKATSERAGDKGEGQKGGDRDPVSGLPWIAPEQLPAEARRTLELIERGGPYPYDKDGSTFGNFEGVLPRRDRGYYKEYTVPTPGERDRGARRIVTGNGDRELYWTADHYASFQRIRR